LQKLEGLFPLNQSTLFFLAFSDNIKLLDMWMCCDKLGCTPNVSLCPPEFSLGVQILRQGLLALDFKQSVGLLALVFKQRAALKDVVRHLFSLTTGLGDQLFLCV
jgi:hypothetical protein